MTTSLGSGQKSREPTCSSTVGDNDKSDIDFLHSQIDEYVKIYETLDELCPWDLSTSEAPLRTSDDDQRCARLAESHGFDGNIFWNLEPDSRTCGPDLNSLSRIASERIELIPKIIGAIKKKQEAPDDGIPAALVKGLPRQSLKILEFLWDGRLVTYDDLEHHLSPDRPRQLDAQRKAVERLNQLLSDRTAGRVVIKRKNQRAWIERSGKYQKTNGQS